MLNKIYLFGIGITNASIRETLEYIDNSLKRRGEKYYIVTPNPELVMIGKKNPDYVSILNNAELALCDGIGLYMASKFLGKPVKERITGVALMQELCKRLAKKPITVGFLGGRPGVAEKTAECLVAEYPRLKVVFAGEEWRDQSVNHQAKIEARNLKLENKEKSFNFQSSNFNNLPSSFYNPSSKSIDVLFVAFGSPKQEEWISKNLLLLPVRIAIGVGGAFDFIAGSVPRAPKIVQTVGLEWLFRLIVQPWRLKRQIKLIQFLILALQERLNF